MRGFHFDDDKLKRYATHEHDVFSVNVEKYVGLLERDEAFKELRNPDDFKQLMEKIKTAKEQNQKKDK